jgi:serine/threonine protein kinase
MDEGSTNQLVTSLRTNILYQLGAQLGRGGYGNVYLATQMSNEKLVVVKKISCKLVKKFVKDSYTPMEVAFMKIMGTSVTVEVLDYFRFEYHYFIVMANENKIDLYQYINLNPLMPEVNAQRVFSKVFKIVMSVTRMGILHGDLKGWSTKTKRGGWLNDFMYCFFSNHICLLYITGYDVFSRNRVALFPGIEPLEWSCCFPGNGVTVAMEKYLLPITILARMEWISPFW